MATTQPPNIQFIALARLVASPTQPRKNFSEDALAELAASIKEIGVIQPLNVRRQPGIFDQGAQAEAELYEIIFGERRFRGSLLAGLEDAPCIIREWNDREVVEAQLIENLQRQDLDPIEESESYHQTLELLEPDGQKTYSVESLAKKIGREANYIYRRLKFRQLPKEARDALLGRIIGTEIASIIARIPSENHRAEATSKIIRPEFQEGQLSLRQAREMIQRDFMRELRRAPFDQADATLFPSMGACTTCQYRTGNSPALFGDVQRGDVCTFPSCYRAKVDVLWERATATAKAEGKTILPSAESETLFNDDGKLAWNSRFVRFGDQPSEDLVIPTTRRLPTWRDLLKKAPAQVEIFVARTPRGAVHELALLKDALAAAKLAKPELFVSPRGETAPAKAPAHPPAASVTVLGAPPVSSQEEFPTTPTNAEAEAERQRSERLKTRIDLAVLKQVVASLVERIKSDGETPPPCFWTALLPLAVAHAGKEGCSFVAERRALDSSIFKETPNDAASCLENEVCIGELPALIAELLLGQYLRYQGGENSPLLEPLLKAYEIDVAAIRRNVETAHKPTKPKKDTPELQ